VLRIVCANCGARLKIPSDYVGREAKCPKCRKPFRVAAPQSRPMMTAHPTTISAAPNQSLRPQEPEVEPAKQIAEPKCLLCGGSLEKRRPNTWAAIAAKITAGTAIVLLAITIISFVLGLLTPFLRPAFEDVSLSYAVSRGSLAGEMLIGIFIFAMLFVPVCAWAAILRGFDRRVWRCKNCGATFERL